MKNPLLDTENLPHFCAIQPEHVQLAVQEIIAESREQLETLLSSNTVYTWDNLLQPFEDNAIRLENAWSPVHHMNSVTSTPAFRDAHNACLPLLSEYGTELGQHEPFFKAIQSIKDSDTFSALSQAQQKFIDDELRDFTLAGVALPNEKKKRYAELTAELSKLTNQFEENVLDATNAWTKLITEESQLAGLPEQAKEELKNEGGWKLTLQYPCYHAVITYADDANLREEMYRAFTTRASDLGDPKLDNSQVMNNILAKRHEKAQLLGFSHYAEYSLATKMATDPKEVTDFLTDLAQKAKPQAQKEFDNLVSYAKDVHGKDTLAAWDLSYYAEKLRQQRYDISEAQIRPYFPEPIVFKGMFAVVEKIFGLQITEVSDFERWHKDVRLFDIFDRDGKLRGKLYTDIYAREHKRGGAWMDECRVKHRFADGHVQTPVAYLTCNLSKPTQGKPALFNHDEVVTLFHEFGHCLHHLLTQIDCAGVSGINGVPWDAVEFPSQFMEHFCWQPESLALISGHYETGAPLPKDLLDKMLAAKNFQAAMALMRQLEFSLFDFRLHAEYQPGQENPVQDRLDEVRAEVSVVPVPNFNRFQHGFSHIFAGGYAAGYYSYKWAEVLSADAFGLFLEQGVLNSDTGKSYMENVLEMGGSVEPAILFERFRGRAPSIDALLEDNGIELSS